MLLNDVIKKINEDGRVGYFQFETLVLHLLKHHLESNGKKLETHLSMSDAIAPDGFDNFQGKTLIEIKYRINHPTVKAFIQRLADNVVENEISNVLIIFADPIQKNIKKIKLSFVQLKLPFEVIIWGLDELNSIARQHKDKTNKIVKNLFSLQLQSAISETTENWKDSQKEIIEKLKKCYEGGLFSLFLGAGVSKSAGMLDWNKLLNSLFVEHLTKESNSSELDANNSNPIELEDIKKIVSRLTEIDNSSALMAARYLRKGLGDSFQCTIKQGLYELRDKKYKEDSNLIKLIVEMCIPKRTGAKVKSIITYNFDDLIEKQLHKNSLSHHCIYTENETYTLDELPIYHVHGFLPEKNDNYGNLDDSTLVFSEEAYHQIYSEPYHWSNLVQLNSLRENNCLMIGLSMTDPNLRRLLDISSKNTGDSRDKHFAFIQRVSEDNFCYKKDDNGDKTQVVDNLENASEFLKRHHVLNEQLMRELGVAIIWYENYDDIPKILDEITKSC